MVTKIDTRGPVGKVDTHSQGVRVKLDANVQGEDGKLKKGAAVGELKVKEEARAERRDGDCKDEVQNVMVVGGGGSGGWKGRR